METGHISSQVLENYETLMACQYYEQEAVD